MKYNIFIMEIQFEPETKFTPEIKRIPRPGYKFVKSLMTGKEIEIPVDTPFCCDPSTETFWCM
jgi:hypothetical protein